MKRWLIYTLLLFSTLACNKPNLEEDVPFCINNRIKKIMKEPVLNPPGEVWKWETNSETYYYFSSGCCDQLNYLYDDKCNEVCAPDGGFTGMGSGNCPEFDSTLTKTLIWKDDR